MNSTSMKKFVAWLVVLTCIAALTGIATTPKLQESVRINSLQLIGDPTAGANVEMKVTYTSQVNGEARLVFGFSGFIKPDDALPTETRREETVSLIAGQTEERRITLKVLETGASHISVAISLDKTKTGYTRGHARYLNIESTQETFAIFDDRSPAAVKEIIPHFGSDNPLGGEWPMGLTTLYTVSITGKFEFDDANEFPVKRKGLYQNTVQLWFRNTANPNTWYHPVYSSDCYGTQHTHYDILDVNGSYSFNFTFMATSALTIKPLSSYLGTTQPFACRFSRMESCSTAIRCQLHGFRFPRASSEQSMEPTQISHSQMPTNL